MAFRPDTKYYIGSKEYDTIYEAFDAVRTMAKGTVIKDKNGTTVFTKDNNSNTCLLYTSPSPRDAHESRMPSSA